MAVYSGGVKYIPGTYVKTRPNAAELSRRYVSEWEEKRMKTREREARPVMPPSICLSRKVGVGALEIADIVAEKTGYRVVDREILEHIANKARLSEKAVTLFDERYPGRIREFLSMAFGEKAFIRSDYTKHLFSTVFAIAGLETTIFVGRGVHLLLPRDRVLAVRFICSDESRINRLSTILNAEPEEVERKLKQIDREQRDFFKKVYGKKDAPSSEFDMVINCDYIKEPQWVAEIVDKVFHQKFGAET